MKIIKVVICLSTLLFVITLGHSSVEASLIRASKVQGQAFLIKKNRQGAKLASGQIINQREVILTTGDGTLELAFASGNFVTIGPNGKLAVIANNQDGLFLSLYNGNVKIEKKAEQRIYLQTPNSFTALRQSGPMIFLAQFDVKTKISTIYGYEGMVEMVAKQHHPFPKGVAPQIYLDQLIGLDGFKLNKGQVVTVSMDSKTTSLVPTMLNPVKIQELVAQMSFSTIPTPVSIKTPNPANPAVVVYQTSTSTALTPPASPTTSPNTPPPPPLEELPEKLIEYYGVDEVYSQISNDYWDEMDFTPHKKSTNVLPGPPGLWQYPQWHLSTEQKGGQSAVEFQEDGARIIDLYHRFTMQYTWGLSLLATPDLTAHLKLSYHQLEFKGNSSINPQRDLFHLQLAMHASGSYPWDLVLGLRDRVFISEAFSVSLPEKVHVKKLIIPYLGIAPLFSFGIPGQWQHTFAPQFSLLAPPLAQDSLKISYGYQWGLNYRLALPAQDIYQPHLLLGYFYERSYSPSQKFHQQEFSMGIDFQW